MDAGSSGSSPSSVGAAAWVRGRLLDSGGGLAALRLAEGAGDAERDGGGDGGRFEGSGVLSSPMS
jgi:hypothetical protein